MTDLSKMMKALKAKGNERTPVAPAKSVRRFAARVQAFCSKSHIAAGSSGNENSNPSSARRRDAQ